jgi:hypothetical protein
MAAIPLAGLLVDLLKGHHVDALVRDDMVYLPALDRWANLWMHQTGKSTWLVEVRATTASPDTTIADRCAAVGDTIQVAGQDGLQAFCSGIFHVLLAAVWGVLEREQVDHEVRVVGGRSWDIYFGPCTLRSMTDTEPLVLPAELMSLVPKQLDRTLTDTRVHTTRLYLAVLNGEVTVEAMVDDAPSEAMAQVFRSAAWVLPKKGFASIRWLIAASPQTNGPSHRIERPSCPG